MEHKEDICSKCRYGKIVITAPSSSVTKDGLAITHWRPLPEPPEEG